MDQPPVDVVDRDKPTVIEVEFDFCAICDIDVPARVYAKLPSGRTWALCGHRGTEQLGALLDAGATIIDHRDHILG